MKKIIITFLIISLSPVIFAKDYHKTEEIINNILNESEEKTDPGTADAIDDSAKKNTVKTDKNEKEKEKKEDESKPSVSTEEEVLLKTGIQFFNNAIYNHSLKNFRELNSKYPGSIYNSRSKIWIARILLKQYKYSDAIKELTGIPENSAEYPYAMFLIGEGHMGKGDLLSSIEKYQKVTSRFPEHELADNALLKLGRLYLSSKKGSQALDSAVRLIKYYKTRETIDDAYYLLGKIYETDPIMKNIETARRVYRLFLKKAATDARFRKSPLLRRAKKDLARIEKNYFKLEN